MTLQQFMQATWSYDRWKFRAYPLDKADAWRRWIKRSMVA